MIIPFARRQLVVFVWKMLVMTSIDTPCQTLVMRNFIETLLFSPYPSRLHEKEVFLGDYFRYVIN